MKSYEAIGVIETQYFAVAMEILDSVSKAANVEFISSEKQLGGRLVSLIVGGGISDVTVAVETAKLVCQNKPNSPLKMALTITNPHEEILKYLISSEKEEEKKPKRITKKTKDKDASKEEKTDG